MRLLHIGIIVIVLLLTMKIRRLLNKKIKTCMLVMSRTGVDCGGTTGDGDGFAGGTTGLGVVVEEPLSDILKLNFCVLIFYKIIT